MKQPRTVPVINAGFNGKALLGTSDVTSVHAGRNVSQKTRS